VRCSPCHSSCVTCEPLRGPWALPGAGSLPAESPVDASARTLAETPASPPATWTALRRFGAVDRSPTRVVSIVSGAAPAGRLDGADPLRIGPSASPENEVFRRSNHLPPLGSTTT